MLLVGSANAAVGMEAAWENLVSGGSALDAVETAVRLVEDNPDDHLLHGTPNALRIRGVIRAHQSAMNPTQH